MHERYEDPDLKRIWNGTATFAGWRDVECTVLEVRETGLERVPEGTADRVRECTWVDDEVVRLIKRRDKAIGHDLQAFVDVMRLQLILHQERREFWDTVKTWTLQAEAETGDPKESEKRVQDRIAAALRTPCREAELFHDGMTSYDTEEPAMALQILEACTVIHERLAALDAALLVRARTHRGLVMIGRTHGQWAQPVTFGVKALNWLDAVRTLRRRFDESASEMAVMKLSGAVGMYGTLDPDVENEVAAALGLESVIATQIVGLGRKAQLANTLSEIAAEVGKIAHDLWLMAQSDVGEIREPFGAAQKGSSAMPHKKNPIGLEQLFGLPRLVRGYAQALLENVDTHHERDISQSSVERVAVPDAFHATGHLLRRLTRIIEGMEVFPERMAANLERARGTYASQAVERFLKEHGMDAETAYRVVQAACVRAMDSGKSLLFTLGDDPKAREIAGSDAQACKTLFDLKTWCRHEDDIYARFDARWTKASYPPVLMHLYVAGED